MAKPRILVGDDHILLVEAIRAVLKEHFEVVGVANNGRDLALEAHRLLPDVVLLDISMPILNGIEAARQIRESVPTARLIFLTQTTDRAYVQAALAAGASGYLIKQFIASELASAIWKVLNGEIYLSASLRAQLPEALAPCNDSVEDLTPRQREILQLMAAGKANEEVAQVLQTSVRTVDFHQTRIRETLNLRSTEELIRYAMEHGLCNGKPR